MRANQMRLPLRCAAPGFAVIVDARDDDPRRFAQSVACACRRCAATYGCTGPSGYMGLGHCAPGG